MKPIRLLPYTLNCGRRCTQIMAFHMCKWKGSLHSLSNSHSHSHSHFFPKPSVLFFSPAAIHPPTAQHQSILQNIYPCVKRWLYTCAWSLSSREVITMIGFGSILPASTSILGSIAASSATYINWSIYWWETEPLMLMIRFDWLIDRISFSRVAHHQVYFSC